MAKPGRPAYFIIHALALAKQLACIIAYTS